MKHLTLSLVLTCTFAIGAATAMQEVVRNSGADAASQVHCVNVSEADCDLTKKAADRVLAVAEAPDGYVWPPTILVTGSDELNAMALGSDYETYKLVADHYGLSDAPSRGDAHHTLMIFTKPLMDVIVEGEEDRLALVMGHELGHLMEEHSRKGAELRKTNPTDLIDYAFGRQDELDADLIGTKLALAAGYSYDKIFRGFSAFIDAGMEHGSFHALNSDHPSWRDRLAYVDERRADLWRAMSSFENGVIFLMAEQYQSAQRAFGEVTKNFPDSPEAWANIGYAYLMQYCDALDPVDVKRFGVGHLLVGGFYRRPASLEGQVRGVDENIWWEAVGALREALRLDPTLTLAKANLGIAYLLRPEGKDVAQAAKLLDEAATLAQNDDTLDPIARASILINAGVAGIAEGTASESEQRFDEAEAYGRSVARRGVPATVETALLYNRAFIMADRPGKTAEAIALLEDYLKSASSSSAWWDLAYERYAALCETAGTAAKSRDSIIASSAPRYRPFTSVELGDGVGIALGEKTRDVRKRIGEGSSVPLAGRQRLSRIFYRDLGVELLANTEVLAIALKGDNAPALSLTPIGIGSKEVLGLHLGMSRDNLEEATIDEEYDFKQLTDPETNYRFYRGLGLAVKVKSGVVREIIVVQLPVR